MLKQIKFLKTGCYIEINYSSIFIIYSYAAPNFLYNVNSFIILVFQNLI